VVVDVVSDSVFRFRSMTIAFEFRLGVDNSVLLPFESRQGKARQVETKYRAVVRLVRKLVSNRLESSRVDTPFELPPLLVLSLISWYAMRCYVVSLRLSNIEFFASILHPDQIELNRIKSNRLLVSI